MLIYNTLSGKKEDLDQALGGAKKIRMFVCGPTVYDYTQIGNARTYVSFDMIARYLRSVGYKIFYLQNITDIDDKIIRRAQERAVKPSRLAAEYTSAYFADMKKIGIKSVNKYALATKYIKQIIRQVEALLQKNHAYVIDGDGIYFNIKTFPDYGKLAKRTVQQSEDAVSRIDESVGKRNRGDFALWKFWHAKNAHLPNGSGNANAPMRIIEEPYWNAPFGKGRPGWHIEDTAITEHYFGSQYELHGGAVDLVFPHHEAEIAQQESASGKKPFVKIWMHGGFLNIGGEKMSKSRAGFITLREFLKSHSSNVFRYMAASHHYRAPMEYSDDLIRQADNTLNNLGQFLAKLGLVSGSAAFPIYSYDRLFAEKMNDDFNTPEALAVIFKMQNEIHPVLWGVNKRSAKEIRDWLRGKMALLGIDLKMPKIPLKIKRLSKKRELSRRSKQFAQSDALRHEIEQLGYIVEDTPAGPFLWPKQG